MIQTSFPNWFDLIQRPHSTGSSPGLDFWGWYSPSNINLIRERDDKPVDSRGTLGYPGFGQSNTSYCWYLLLTYQMLIDVTPFISSRTVG